MGVFVCAGGWAVLTTATHAQNAILHLHSIPIKLKIVGGSFPPFNLNFWDLRGLGV